MLAVVLFHFSPDIAPGGFLGVDIFFVLSGFLITSLLVNERERTRRISLRQFWLRRARRLLPALFLVLAAVGLYALLVASKVAAHHMAEDGLATLGYIANWHFIASGQAYVEQFIQQAPSPLRHTWSLAIEEQFYLLWPLVVVGIGILVARTRARRSQRELRAHRRFRRTVVIVCVVLGALSLIEMIALFNVRDPDRVYYGTDTRAFLLLIGATLGALTAGALGVARRAPESPVDRRGLWRGARARRRDRDHRDHRHLDLPRRLRRDRRAHRHHPRGRRGNRGRTRWRVCSRADCSWGSD